MIKHKYIEEKDRYIVRKIDTLMNRKIDIMIER